ncbi:MAG: nitrate/nitrite transporter NrtS [Clostridia bacterium]
MPGPRRLGSRELYCRFETRDGPVVKRQLEAIFYPPLVKTATKTALVVGTVLALINHGGVLLSGHMTGTLALKILLTFVVPYAVATYGAVSTSRIDPKDEVA